MLPTNQDTSNPAPLEALVAQRVSVIPVLCTQLRQTLRQMDDSVGGVCGSFQGISTRAQDSIARASRFLGAKMQGGDADNESLTSLIQQAQRTLEDLLERSARASQQSADAVERLRTVSQASEQIQKALASLNDMAIGNKLVAINARIEAARLGAQAAGFNVVADEILAQTRFSTSVVETVQSLATDLSTAATTTIGILQATTQEDLAALAVSRREVSHALERFSATLDAVRQFADESSQDSQRLADEISAAVRGLQFHDRTTQRVQHVIEELEDMHSSLGSQVNLDSQNTANALQQLSRRYTMAEEHLTDGAKEISSGDVELF